MRDWQAVRADESIQFAPLPERKAAETPEWLQRLLEWLGEVFAPVAEMLGAALQAIGLSWPVLQWILLALIVAGAAILAFTYIRPRWQRPSAVQAAPEWAPDRRQALDLIAEADRLAAEGSFDAATHLLLQRSVGQIAEVRPDLLRPSSTASEIAALPVLSDAAREAFSAIATRVERSLFALRQLDRADWEAAREAYA
ncbi:MAG TPA: hypothetical protein VLC53_02485, partial [Myxococcota bacterium]|nr:hypothetical protein [Myxococcota bacterium]